MAKHNKGKCLSEEEIAARIAEASKQKRASDKIQKRSSHKMYARRPSEIKIYRASSKHFGYKGLAQSQEILDFILGKH